MTVTQEQIDNFHQFASDKLSNGGADLTIDDLYELWRLENPTQQERNDELLAVKAALKDMESGDTGQPFDQFDREFRARNSIQE